MGAHLIVRIVRIFRCLLNRFPSSPDPSVEDRLFYLAVRTVLTASSSTAIAGGVSFWFTPARTPSRDCLAPTFERSAHSGGTLDCTHRTAVIMGRDRKKK